MLGERSARGRIRKDRKLTSIGVDPLWDQSSGIRVEGPLEDKGEETHTIVSHLTYHSSLGGPGSSNEIRVADALRGVTGLRASWSSMIPSDTVKGERNRSYGWRHHRGTSILKNN